MASFRTAALWNIISFLREILSLEVLDVPITLRGLCGSENAIANYAMLWNEPLK